MPQGRSYEPGHLEVNADELDRHEINGHGYVSSWLFQCYARFRQLHPRQDKTNLILLWESDFRTLVQRAYGDTHDPNRQSISPTTRTESL